MTEERASATKPAAQREHASQPRGMRLGEGREMEKLKVGRLGADRLHVRSAMGSKRVKRNLREKWRRVAAVGSAWQRVAVVVVGGRFSAKKRCYRSRDGSELDTS